MSRDEANVWDGRPKDWPLVHLSFSFRCRGPRCWSSGPGSPWNSCLLESDGDTEATTQILKRGTIQKGKICTWCDPVKGAVLTFPYLERVIAGFVQVVQGSGSLHAIEWRRGKYVYIIYITARQGRGSTNGEKHIREVSLTVLEDFICSYLVLRGSGGPLPCSFFTSSSLLRRMTSLSLFREPLRWSAPLPSCRNTRHHKNIHPITWTQHS